MTLPPENTTFLSRPKTFIPPWLLWSTICSPSAGPSRLPPFRSSHLPRVFCAPSFSFLSPPSHVFSDPSNISVACTILYTHPDFIYFFQRPTCITRRNTLRLTATNSNKQPQQQNFQPATRVHSRLPALAVLGDFAGRPRLLNHRSSLFSSLPLGDRESGESSVETLQIGGNTLCMLVLRRTVSYLPSSLPFPSFLFHYVHYPVPSPRRAS